MKKLMALFVVLGLMTSCSTHKVTDPVALKSNASGTPVYEGEGGGEGGGPATTFDVAASGATGIVSLAGFNGPNAKAYLFTFQLSGGLALANGLSSVHPGSWFTDNDPSPIWSVTTNQNGSISVVLAMNPGHCNTVQNNGTGGTIATIATTGHGTLSLVGSPPGAVTPSPTLRDCENYGVGVQYGTASVGM